MGNTIPNNTMSIFSRTIVFLAFAMTSAFAANQCEVEHLGHPACPSKNTTFRADGGGEWWLCNKHKDANYQDNGAGRRLRRLASEPLANSGRRRLGWKPSDDIPRRQF